MILKFVDLFSVGVAIEAVQDSSRYFVIRVLDDNGEFFLSISYCVALEIEFSYKTVN